MKSLLVTFLRRQSISLLLFAVLSCDTFEEEVPDEGNQFTFSQTEFYTLPSSAIVIDVKAILEKSLVSGSLTIAENPTKGTLTRMDAFVFKYLPFDNFIEGQDQFTFGAVLDDGRTIKGKSMTIYMKSSRTQFPCGLYPVEDITRLDTAASSFVIHVLKNDRICEVDEPLNVVVHLAPKFGEAVVVGDSLMYTPGPTFSWIDEFVYSVSTSSGDPISFGLVSLKKSPFEILKIPVGFTSISFVDDTIGFIAGYQTIQKTTDGGRHWTQLTHPASENNYIKFEYVYFLDKDHGFAAFSEPYSDCQYGLGGELICPWTYMETRNGGESWVMLDQAVFPLFEYPPQPVIDFHVSNLPILSQGFSPDGNLGVVISGTSWSGEPARPMLKISIIKNRGQTWVGLDERSDGYPWAISVPSSNAAYILCWGKILKLRP